MGPKLSEAQTIEKKNSRATTVILDVYEVGSNRKIHLPIGKTCDQEIQEQSWQCRENIRHRQKLDSRLHLQRLFFTQRPSGHGLHHT